MVYGKIEGVLVCGRVSHNRGIANLRHKGDAGNGQRVEMVQWYIENGAEVGKGWGKRGRVPGDDQITALNVMWVNSSSASASEGSCKMLWAAKSSAWG